MRLSDQLLPSSFLYLLSPADRLFFTFTPNHLKEMGIVSTKPLYVFGSGDISYEIIDSTEKALSFIDLPKEGIHLADPEGIDLRTILNHAIRSNVLIVEGEYANINGDDGSRFMLDRSLLQSIQPQIQTQLNSLRTIPQ